MYIRFEKHKLPVNKENPSCSEGFSIETCRQWEKKPGGFNIYNPRTYWYNGVCDIEPQ
ncbi:hypothetical protein SAMN05518683_13114 [Salibacterium halotolerans]|uniref:Uncharacterized protein n=1 Tax=Salibacterium halotolerans TaxID=1884432 RepID=A0A1I5XTW9_9BACI|nr:hypothetical protein SAMN05518683_13114 [Salibacterium halotolerans]